MSETSLLRGVLLRRMLAWWVDICIAAVLGMIGWLLLVTVGVLTFGLGFHLLFILPLLPVVYNWGFLASDLQATPGQAAFGLIVVRDEDLGRPGVGQAMVWVLTFDLTLAICAPLVLVALFSTRYRALHDIFAGLTVVRRDEWLHSSGGW